MITAGYSGKKLEIPDSWKVVDVGSGHHPHPRTNVLVNPDDDNVHRGRSASEIKRPTGVPFVLGSLDGRLPFSDNEFDFSFCLHVLEHVEDPEAACLELSRISKGGYIETPAPVQELLIGDPCRGGKEQAHKWYVENVEGALVFRRIRRYRPFGDFFDRSFYQGRENPVFKSLMSAPEVFYTRLLWSGSVRVRDIIK